VQKKTRAYIGHNLWSGTVTSLVDASAVLNGATVTNNWRVTPAILNTNRPYGFGFMQPDAGTTPEVLQGYGIVSNGYPAYIGAVAPAAPIWGGVVVLLH
jgi:hypothetical protein